MFTPGPKDGWLASTSTGASCSGWVSEKDRCYRQCVHVTVRCQDKSKTVLGPRDAWLEYTSI